MPLSGLLYNPADKMGGGGGERGVVASGVLEHVGGIEQERMDSEVVIRCGGVEAQGIGDMR